MHKTLKNALSVLAATAVTVAVIVTAVTLFGGSYVAGDLASASALTTGSGQTQVMTCPATGCTETYCHATGEGSSSAGGGYQGETM